MPTNNISITLKYILIKLLHLYLGWLVPFVLLIAPTACSSQSVVFSKICPLKKYKKRFLKMWKLWLVDIFQEYVTFFNQVVSLRSGSISQEKTKIDNYCTVHTNKETEINKFRNYVMCNKMEWHREKILNTLSEIYSILHTKAFVGNDSFKTPPVWRN